MHYGFNADIPTFLGQCVIYFLKSKTKVRGTSPKWALKCLIKEGLTTLNISKNAHLDQLVEPLWPQVVRCVEEEADEGTLSILPLQRRYLITTVQHLRIKTSAFLASAYFAPAYFALAYLAPPYVAPAYFLPLIPQFENVQILGVFFFIEYCRIENQNQDTGMQEHGM